MMQKEAVDIVQPDLIKAGGFSVCKKVAALAEAFGCVCTPHQTQPLGNIANLHFVAATPCCRYSQEYNIERHPIGDKLFKNPLPVIDGYMKKTLKILVVSSLSDDQFFRIQSVSDDVRMVVARSKEEQLTEVEDADVIFGGFNHQLLERAKKLKWVQVISAGVDSLLFPEFVESDIILTSAKGYVGTHLADQTWALILGLLRGIGRAVRERTWKNRSSIREEAWELDGRTLGIIGLGGTGVEVARRSIGFRMHVIAVEPEDVEKPEFVDEVWKMVRFYELLQQSDVVCICAPLTDETRGMFDLEAFRKMKRHALLINVTRGKIVDGPSLLQALQEGLIGGAGLDVTPEEPLPPDSPLWDMKNVIITPHVAGGSPLRLDRSVGLFCDNLRKFIAEEPLMSVIDKHKGY